MPSRNLTLLSRTLRSPETYIGDPILLPPGVRQITAELIFLYGANGTTCDVYLQTSLDGGVTWIDIMQWAVTTSAATRVHAVRADIALSANYTPTDGSLADNTIKDGLIGDRIRSKLVTTGTYTGVSKASVHAVAN